MRDSLKTRLKDDRDGDEQLLPLFVMAAAVLVCICVLSAAITSAIARNQPTARWHGVEGYQLIGGVNYNCIAPTEGYNVTMNETHDSPWQDEDKFEFDYASWPYLTVRMVRAGSFDMSQVGETPIIYYDFFWIHAKKSSAWNAKSTNAIIPYQDFETRFLENNVSYAYFELWNYNFTLLVTTQTNDTDHSDHLTMLYTNQFNIRVAENVDINEDAAMHASMWTILGQILTLSLPNVNFVVNLLMSVPIWAAMGFMVFTIFSRVIPFISGG